MNIDHGSFWNVKKIALKIRSVFLTVSILGMESQSFRTEFNLGHKEYICISTISITFQKWYSTRTRLSCIVDDIFTDGVAAGSQQSLHKPGYPATSQSGTRRVTIFLTKFPYRPVNCNFENDYETVKVLLYDLVYMQLHSIIMIRCQSLQKSGLDRFRTL